MVEFGTAVKAYPLDESGPKVGFFLGREGDKANVQVGSNVETLAYREPADYDDQGPNGTYCAL